MIDVTARGSGYYKTYSDDVYVSQHTAEREALERCVEILAVKPTARVHYTHEYTVDVELVDEAAPVLPEPVVPTESEPSTGVEIDILDKISSMMPDPTGVPIETDSFELALPIFAARHRDSWKVSALMETQPDGKNRLAASTFLGYVMVWKWGRRFFTLSDS